MKQREALNSIYNDILQISKQKNRTLTIALCISVALNIILVCMIFQVRIDSDQSVDEALMLTTVAIKKPSEHIVTRSKLKEIPDIKTFEELLQRCILTDDEKYILREHYLHGRSLLAISMGMGYSEDAIKHRHQKILKRIKMLL